MNNLFKSGVLALTLCLGVFASAQYERDRLRVEPYNVTFRLGIGLPFDSNFAAGEDLFYGLGMDYGLQGSIVRGGHTFFSVDWFNPTGGDIGKNDAFNFAVNQRFYTGDGYLGERTYFFVGLGTLFVDGETGKDEWLISGRVGVGKEINESLVAEISLLLSEDTRGGANPTTASIHIGYRF